MHGNNLLFVHQNNCENKEIKKLTLFSLLTKIQILWYLDVVRVIPKLGIPFNIYVENVTKNDVTSISLYVK